MKKSKNDMEYNLPDRIKTKLNGWTPFLMLVPAVGSILLISIYPTVRTRA